MRDILFFVRRTGACPRRRTFVAFLLALTVAFFGALAFSAGVATADDEKDKCEDAKEDKDKADKDKNKDKEDKDKDKDKPYPPKDKCDVKAEKSEARAGETMTISGEGFPPNSSVDLTLEPAGSTTAAASPARVLYSGGGSFRVLAQASPVVQLGTVMSDANGSFTAEVRIPPGISPGRYRIRATSGPVSQSIDIEVRGAVEVAGVSQTRSAPASGILASTGARVAATTTAAAALIAIGLLFVLAARRGRVDAA